MISEMTDRDALIYAFKGDTAAVELAFALARVSHIWDDLVDRDQVVDEARVNEAFWTALIGIPGNGFYQKHLTQLLPVLATGALNWIAATRIERERPSLEALQVAHVIRYSIADVLLLMATLIGGAAWAFEVGAELRLRAQKSGFLDYVKEHSQ